VGTEPPRGKSTTRSSKIPDGPQTVWARDDLPLRLPCPPSHLLKENLLVPLATKKKKKLPLQPGPTVKSPKNNKPASATKDQGSEWIDEDPKMQLAGDAGPAQFSRAQVFLEATTASGSPSAPNEAPKETGHVPAPGKYTHVTAGGAK